MQGQTNSVLKGLTTVTLTKYSSMYDCNSLVNLLMLLPSLRNASVVRPSWQLKQVTNGFAPSLTGKSSVFPKEINTLQGTWP